jgi:hypothetical protein
MSQNVQAEEFQAFFTRARRNPVFFVNALIRPGTRARTRDGTVLIHHGQEKWLKTATADINVLQSGNRFGKSVVGGHRHADMAFHKKGIEFHSWDEWLNEPYETLATGFSGPQAEIIFKNVRRMITSPAFKPFVKRIQESPYPRITLYNNAVINIRSAHDGGKYIDGFTYKYVSVDEAGWFGNNLIDLINNVLLMRMAGGGLMDLIGTPKGRHQKGLWYYANRGSRGVPGYYTMRGSSFDNPFLSKKDLKKREEILRMSDPKMRQQVIEGEFVDTAGLTFTADQQDNLFNPKLPVHQDYIEGHKYIQAWDLGRLTDYTVGMTADITDPPPWPIVDYMRLNKVPWEEIYAIIGGKKAEYHVNLPRIDGTGPQGDVIEEELWKRGIAVEGFKISNGQIKTDLINSLQTALDWNRQRTGTTQVPDEAGHWYDVPVMEEPDPSGKAWGLLRCPSIPQVIDEIGVYTLPDTDLVQDTVVTLAMLADRAMADWLIQDPVKGGLYG